MIPESPDGARSRPRRTFLLVAGAVLLALIAGAVVWWIRPAGDPIALEPAAELGQDPFVDAAGSSPAAEFSETLRARVIETTSALTREGDTGVRLAAGDTAGLYGGSTSDAVCDVAALTEFLQDNQAKAAAWAQVRGIGVAEIADHLEGLAAVYLTVDTAVVNHGFDGTKATPRNSVLQAGTAVLVDDRGLPAVRCSCGNPLLPLGSLDTGAVSFAGPAWDDFEAAKVVAVSPASGALESIAVTDLRTGELVEVPLGPAAPPVLVATSVDGMPESATAGAVHTSLDGTGWEKVLDTGPLYAVDTGPGLAVAVGADGRGRGIVHTSTDGRSWSEPIDVIDPLTGVAYGDGVWIAVGNRSFLEESGEGDGSSGAIYRSTDGHTWTRVATTDPYENSELASSGELMYQSMGSVGYGDGLWLATATECAYRICELVEFTSPDGRAWTRRGLDESIVRIDADHDGTRWGFVGGERDPAGIEISMADKDRPLGLAGTSPDGVTWSTGATEPGRPVLAGLDAGPDGWYAVDVPTYGSQGTSPSQGGVYRSPDLKSWEQLGTVTPGITGIAVLVPGRDSGPSATPAGTPTPAPPPASESAQVSEVRILTRGIMLMTDAESPVLLYADAAATATEALTGVLGQPATTRTKGDGQCSADGTVLQWDGFTISFDGTDSSAPWRARLQGTRADLPDVPVGVAEGVTLGTSADDVALAFPGAPHESFSHEGVAYDLFVLDTSENGEQGTEVMATDGVVSTISAPQFLQGDC